MKVSPQAVDLMKRLMAEKTDRYGHTEILRHNFFKSLKWDKIRQGLICELFGGKQGGVKPKFIVLK